MSTKVSKLATIEDLSCDLFVNIFKKLDSIDLIKLRLVNKSWLKIIKNNFKFDEFNIIDYRCTGMRHHEYNCFYTYLNRAHDYKYSIYYYRRTSFNCIKSLLSQSLFDQLKYLNLSFVISGLEFDLEILNRFNQLENLEIYSLLLDNKISLLNLPNLNTLTIYELKIDQDNLLIIKSSKLKNLKLDLSLLKINFKCEDSINYIHLIMEWDRQLNCLNKFKNLETLNCEINNELDLKLFQNLTKLNLIYTNDDNNIVFDPEFYYDQLLDQRKNLNKLNLQITLNGIKLTESNKINFKSNKYTHIGELQIKFNELLIESPWLNDIIIYESDQLINSPRFNDYIIRESDRFFSYLKDKPMNEIFNKLNNIINVELGDFKKDNEKNLFKLLSKLNNLRILSLFNVGSNQEFYNRLADICPYLKEIRILNSDALNINLEYLIKKLEFLNKLETNIKINHDFLIDYLKTNNHLHQINIFKSYSNSFRGNYSISRICKCKFVFEKSNKVCYDPNILTIDELKIELANQLD